MYIQNGYLREVTAMAKAACLWESFFALELMYIESRNSSNNYHIEEPMNNMVIHIIYDSLYFSFVLNMGVSDILYILSSPFSTCPYRIRPTQLAPLTSCFILNL